ncbi:accessory Sec system translocase SecA2 [Bacillus infantis]|uniref:accessory Sec system translocase SecA2 n=1 Tax=Bacillus infantis TaxID=324767 RepID=UPI003CFB498F
MLTMLKKFGDTNDRRLKKYRKIVEEINSLEPGYQKLSDQELQNKTTEFKQQLSSGEKLENIRPHAFAAVREASRRVLGLRHYDVQLIGGLVLSDGNIAEMPTGEGKTLVASLPSYLRALEGKGVHVITVNDYLAARDRNLVGKIHEFLGLTVGLNVPMLSPEEKKAAYQADITYGIGTEFGFDYLRDNMAASLSQKVQRPYHYTIIDEVDSVLIDEAKTPLIVAGKMESSSELHYIGSRLAKRFKDDVDYTFDVETKATSLTEEGIEKVEKAFGIDNLYELEHQTLYHYMIQAVRAHVMFEKDVDYIIKDGEIKLVDMFTGRIMDGRTLSDGLHQALEAKEGLEITEENKTQASITIQNYFRMYPLLSGMTGTAKTEEKELMEIYGMDVIQIPTNKPIIREDLSDKVYKTAEQKYKAMVEEVKGRHSKGQPILIGTASILQSEKAAEYLKKAGLSFELLNAKTVEQEVRLIEMAGQKGRITIATNMAGRGTDIMLGEGVHDLGGLFVLGTEKHESRRVDNQLKGRSGRQGDPGSSQFFISLEDDMFRRFAKEDAEKLLASIQADGTGLIQGKKIHEFVDRTQRIVEGSNYSMREYNLKLDDVINEQRNVIYHLRNKALSDDNILPVILPMVQSAAGKLIAHYEEEGIQQESLNIKGLAEELNMLLAGGSIDLSDDQYEILDIKEIAGRKIKDYLAYAGTLGEDEMLQNALKHLLTAIIDRNWIIHLENMARLKEGIGMRHYQQEDPMRLYQKEGLELFESTYFLIEKEISRKLAEIIRSISQDS